MDENSDRKQAVELLQQLGLKEYESKAFVALSQFSSATAKQISDNAEIPRTRVYDAVRVLESKGLVEIHHSSPQQFRAVSIKEATTTLHSEYKARTESLQEVLERLETVEPVSDTKVTHEVWALSGEFAIQNRTSELIDDAEEEIVLVIGGSSVFTEELGEKLRAAQEQGVTVIVGTKTKDMQSEVQSAIPNAEVFVSGLEWLSEAPSENDGTEINRLLLVDQSVILVSTLSRPSKDGETHENAVFGRGFDNGFVVITRRLMSTGLLTVDDPKYRNS